ncbi:MULTISPECIES: hypothetical protein [Arthrobacter]|uniref:Uncharacterized protein n=1 Tax=Arthrobacter terricola TaxID=2547396 RepID=A0A4R5KQC0_9MICC|nr:MULTISPECIES: hypothetical protein [Arthrobacter]MBT8161041.1 hypothetical protein [Arthrobacter sp. GN70]TDF96900.1 hypothetical protein E1809_09265 [Arthrobacter terricola]
MKFAELKAQSAVKQQSVLMMLSLERIRTGFRKTRMADIQNARRLRNNHANRATLRAARFGHSEFPATGHIYSGTVDPAEVKRRRAKNKVARRTRAAARKQG